MVYPNVDKDSMTNDVRIKEENRDTIIEELERVGLNVRKMESSDRKNWFILIGISEERLEEQAELNAVELQLKEEYHGGYVAFTRDKKDLFRRQEDGGLFPKTTTQRLIETIIESETEDGGAELNIRSLIWDGVLDKVYPVHENKKKKEIIDYWVKNPKNYAVPLEQLRSYFGEEVAFYYGWLNFYTRWLGFASVVGILAMILGYSGIRNENNWANSVYSIFMAIWATLFLEYWKRERNSLAYKWNMLNFDNAEGIRPGFRGSDLFGAYVNDEFVPLREDEIYGVQAPKKTKFFPKDKVHINMLTGFGIIVTLCIVVVMSTMSILTFRLFVQHSEKYSAYSSIIGGVLNAIAIVVLNKIYRSIAVRMNEWENHRTESAYIDNLLFKIFLFQFVNSYTSLYYIAFFKKGSALWGNDRLIDQCTDGEVADRWGCPEDLLVQLATILATNIVIGQAQEVLIPYITTLVKRAYFNYSTHKTLEDLPKYEKEYSLNPWEGLVDEYGEMVIQYGYLTLFAASFPLAPLLAFVNNIVEVRTDTYKWLTIYNKPFYRGADDIGGWYTILEVLSTIAVITNVLLIGFSFPTLYDLLQDSYAVLWTVVILEHVIILVKFLIASLVPDVPENIRTVIAKQHYIQQQLVKKYERMNLEKQNAKYKVRRGKSQRSLRASGTAESNLSPVNE